MVIDGSNGLTYPNSATNGGYINGGTAVASTNGMKQKHQKMEQYL